MTCKETALAWLAYFYLTMRMITVGSFLMPREEPAQLILRAWLELKQGECDNFLQIFVCWTTICSTNISGNDTRHPGDQAILWVCAVKLIGSLDSGTGTGWASRRYVVREARACAMLRPESMFHGTLWLSGMWVWTVLCSKPLLIWVVLGKLLPWFKPSFPWLKTEIILTIEGYGNI